MLHRRLLQSEGNNALAHYHLGFAYGMVDALPKRLASTTGDRPRAQNRDLFLNLGLAYFDQHELENATAAFETAVSLGPQHAETHFNLAVVYDGRTADEALKEISPR